MPPAKPQGQTTTRSENDRKIFANLREIHTAAHLWQAELTAELDSPAVSQNIASIVAEQLIRKPQIEAVINTNLTAIRALFATDTAEHEWGAATLTELDLTWLAINNLWRIDASKVDQSTQSLRAVRDKLDSIIYTCLSDVLTPDIDDRLPNLEIGQALNLEFVYGPDFPRDPDLRKRLVSEIAQEAGVIRSGVFDPGSNCIYRIAPTQRERRKSLWHLAELIVLGGLLTVAACFVGQALPGWPLHSTDWPRRLGNYFVLMVGAGGHMVIDALKQKRAQAQPSFSAMDNWPLWLHVHEWQMIYAILWADLGFILLTASMPGMGWQGAFAAGYSIDSITDLFLGRFESLMGTSAAKITPAA